ncbi:MAG: hypothetical protein ABSC64_17530 [Candidatus Korobacteraceae bacterium]|jgi:hypothetical protein
MRDFIFTFILAGAGRIHSAQNYPGQNYPGQIAGRTYSEEIHVH